MVRGHTTLKKLCSCSLVMIYINWTYHSCMVPFRAAFLFLIPTQGRAGKSRGPVLKFKRCPIL
jgi:hypothetical protein